MGLTTFFAKQAQRPSGFFGRVFAGRLLNRANAALEDMGLELMDPEPDSMILEIGFGNGRLISKMGERVTRGRITGIDISRAMISQAEKNNRELIDSGRVELIEASVDNIPAEDGSFDRVFTANTIYFWPDTHENIREIMRVLKPGGKFYCAFRIKDEVMKNKMIGTNLDIFRNLFSEHEMKHFLEESGFESVAIHSRRGGITNVVAIGTRGQSPVGPE